MMTEVEATKTEQQDNTEEIPPEWRPSPEKETKEEERKEEKQEVKEDQKERKDYKEERRDYRRDRRDDYGRYKDTKREPVSLFVRGIEPDVKYESLQIIN
jgi:hypothetical protein